MERLYGKAKNANKEVFSDPSHRISQRPGAVKSGEGRSFEDIGSSLSPPRSTIMHWKTPKSKFKPAAAPPVGPRSIPIHITEGESDDELLLSSQNSVGSNATSSPKHVAKGKRPDTHFDAGETVRVNGRVLAAHPDYKPSSSAILKGLRFTKKKSAPDDDAVTEVPPPSSSLTDSQDSFKLISDDVRILDSPPPCSPSSSRQGSFETPPTRQKSPSATRVAPSRFTDFSKSSTSKLPSPTPKDTPRPPVKLRPRPRIVKKYVPRGRDSSPESTPRSAAQKHGLPLHCKTPKPPADADSKPTVKKPPFPSSHREPRAFPVSLQAKENISDSPRSSDDSIKTKKAAVTRAATFVHMPKPISLPSSLKTRSVSRGSTFPTLSPLSSSKDKGKARENYSPEDNIDLTKCPGKHGGPRPFPMSSQLLENIDRRSGSSSTRSPKSTKRTSSDDSGAERGRTTKKHKDSCSGALDALDCLHEPMEDDSIELSYAQDPSKICPYCDEELPPHPTPFLQQLLTTARKKSVSDPRPRNRCGLKAELTIYISVCQRHRFESHQLPIATEKGWPKTIDFSKVPIRVKNMKRDLEAIILDKDDISDIEDLATDDGLRGPRSKSVFWREVKKEVKKQGSRMVVGVKGQFASFEKTQPGYYGEQGSIIIHQTLFDLFPPSAFDASLIAPLAPAEFIQRILVPEAAVRLIAQDLFVDTGDAVVILRESAQYGVAMFPDTGESRRKGAGMGAEDEEMGVADQIVMERARVRRKELAEEEKVEKEMLEEERAAQRAKARERRRKKVLERAQQAKETRVHANGKVVEVGDTSEVSEASATHRTRRGTRQRAATGEPESDAMSVDSLASRRSARIIKVAPGDGAKVVKAMLQLDGSDSDTVDLVGDSKHKAGLGRSKAREPSTHASTVSTASRERKKPFGAMASFDTRSGERESTPRPARQWSRNTTAIEKTAVDSADGPVLPLQIARNRPDASLRTTVPSDPDSDVSNASRRLVRRPIRKGGPESWLFTESSSSDSP